MPSDKALNDVRSVMVLFAGFFIGMHVAVFLHELGHALGYWLAGGTVNRIVMETPLPAGRVIGIAPSAALPVCGGVVFGTLVVAAPLLIARVCRRKPTIRFAALMTAAFCLGHNGMYLFVGGIIPFADAAGMVALGAPRWLLFLLGIPLLVGFALLLTSSIRLVGISSADSLARWVLLVELGLCSFPAVMVGSMLIMPVPSSVRLPTVTFVTCYAVLFAVSAYWARRSTLSSGEMSRLSNLNGSWSAPGALVIAAALLVTAEWLAFGAR